MNVIGRKKYVGFVLFLLLTLCLTTGIYAEIKVYFNLSNNKVHRLNCHWGQRCTKNCIVIPRNEAYQRGGVRCKVCGG